jgi:hypothetical protein
MKTKSKPHYLIMAAIVAVLTAATWSCNKDEDPSLTELREDKLQYLEDSTRIADSLHRINQAGIVNYTITVVNGSTSTLHKNASGAGREGQAQGLDAAAVTISQYGKTETKTTDATGMVVFTGYFRTAVNVNIVKSGFTTADFVIVTSREDATINNSLSSVGNLLPLFETTGANTATISGKATIQTNLTNKTRELVPDGTKITASIDAKNAAFGTRFLTTGIGNIPSGTSTLLYAGEVVDAAYATLAAGTVTGGNYSITAPSAIDGLPIRLEYSELAADQTYFESTGTTQRTVVGRTIFNDNSAGGAPLITLPSSSSVTINFESFKGLNAPVNAATADAIISANTGAIDRINVTNGGTDYNAAAPPAVEIQGGGGSGATATATVGSNGRVTAINITNPGAGYTSIPTVKIYSGIGATATAGLQSNGTVVSVAVTNSGSGYTTAPAVTFPAPGGTGTTATGTATIDALGRVVSITITNAGSQYLVDPGVLTIGAPPAGGVQATAFAYYSGRSVANVTVTAGSEYSYAPKVVFDVPQRANGVRAQGTATIDPITRTVTGIQITDAGSGYTAAPGVSLISGSGVATQVFLTGGSVVNVNITSPGVDYAYAPRVEFVGGNGTGAAGTAVVSGGRVVGINLTSGGTGYTAQPTINFISGSDATAYATIANGIITGFTVTDGGHDFSGAPRVIITSSNGGGATATATVSGGQITAIAVGNGGSGYLEGNFPASQERFSAVKGVTFDAKTGISYINDVYYGTGAVRTPN